MVMWMQLRNRNAHQSWGASLFLLALVALVLVAADIIHSLMIILVAMGCFGLISLVFVRRSHWDEIGLRRPVDSKKMLWGVLITVSITFASFFLLFITAGMTSANFFYLMGRTQTVYGVITPANEWLYYPISLIGFGLVSTLTEELFFRGVLLTSMERVLSQNSANLLTAILFSFNHLLYFAVIDFTPILFISMVPLVALAGYIYGWVKQRTTSYWAAMFTHVIFNVIAITLVYGYIIPLM